jgi:hypothetical protein
MEQLVAPTRRYQELLEDSIHTNEPVEYTTEVQLTVPLGDFLFYSWDWEDLRAFLTGGVTSKILWITEYAFLTVEESGNGFLFDSCTFHSCISAKIQAKTGQEHTLTLANISYQPVLSNRVIVDIFWRAITTSKSAQLRIHDDTSNNSFVLPAGPLLAQFLRGCQSLHFLQFDGVHFKEDHCRALATIERTDLEVTFILCIFEPQGAEEAFIEWFRHSNVVTSLYDCQMKASTLTALSGNNSVKKLTISPRAGEFYPADEMQSLLQALPGNRGIEDISLNYIEMSDETWSLFFRSLSTHPRIKRVSLIYSSARDHLLLSAQSKTARMNAIFQMLQSNTLVHTMILPDDFNDEALYRNAILPRLEMNRTCFKVQRRALKRADPSIRPQLLGRALYVVRYNPNLIFRFLAENVPAFLRAEQEDSTISLQNDPAIVSGLKRKAL